VDGISLGRVIREEFQAALVFVTSHADRQTIERAAAVKPNGYIVKPFVLREVDAAVTTALANFVEEHSSVDLERLNANRADGLSPSIMAKIDDFLDHGFDTEITIEQLAGVAGMSVSLFSRQFKQSTGSSPYHYVVQRRINEAKRLLNHTDLSIAEISLSVGYSNQAHFTTAFKKFCGITPGKYRKL
ncbi:MAG: DNA-binding response regulator, partial [Pseudomonadota bacterium]